MSETLETRFARVETTLAGQTAILSEIKDYLVNCNKRCDTRHSALQVSLHQQETKVSGIESKLNIFQWMGLTIATALGGLIAWAGR